MVFSFELKVLWGVAGLAVALIFFAVLSMLGLVGSRDAIYAHRGRIADAQTCSYRGSFWGARARALRRRMCLLQRLQHVVEGFAV